MSMFLPLYDIITEDYCAKHGNCVHNVDFKEYDANKKIVIFKIYCKTCFDESPIDIDKEELERPADWWANFLRECNDLYYDGGQQEKEK